ncbi:MAG: type II toxin-antitoxin system VapC family toxin [Actinomycetota bacterium]
MEEVRLSEYLLDTHIWFWFMIGSPKLPARLAELVESSKKTCWLSPLSIWELGLLARKGKIELEGTCREWTDRALGNLPLKEATVTNQVASAVDEIKLDHRDPADRFLAATALVYDLTLVTVDKRLIEASWLKTA